MVLASVEVSTMGHQRATLTTDSASISLSVYEEDAEEIDYERVIAQVELETPTGNTYSQRKEVTDTSGDGLLTAIHKFLSSGADTKQVVKDVIDEAIEDAEEDLDTRLNLDTKEIVHEFEQHTKQTA